MAKGQTHALATILAGMCGVMQVPTNADGFFWTLGAIVGTVLQSDLDQIEKVGDKQGGYYGQYVLRETFSPVIERLWCTYWTPYAKVFKHRSPWTHFPPVCTAIRLVYGFWWAIPIYILLPESKIYFILALVVSDTLHFVMDWRLWRKMGFFKQSMRG